MSDCQWCHEPVLPADTVDEFDSSFHYECRLRAVMGSAAHLLKECSCYGGDREDPPGMTRREAAKLAAETLRLLPPEDRFLNLR